MSYATSSHQCCQKKGKLDLQAAGISVMLQSVQSGNHQLQWALASLSPELGTSRASLMLTIAGFVHWTHLPWFSCVAAAALHQTEGASPTLEGAVVLSGSESAISCQHPHSP